LSPLIDKAEVLCKSSSVGIVFTTLICSISLVDFSVNFSAEVACLVGISTFSKTSFAKKALGMM
jgi:hypothetical protein